MANEKIRVGIVGAGANTKAKHIPNLQAIEGVEVAAVCNRSLESSERVAKEFGIAEVYSHWNELVADNDIDALVIGTWPYMHCPVTVAAIAAEKHVLTEARMAMDSAQAHRMLEAARAAPNIVAQVVPSPLTLKFDNTIKKLLAAGEIGTVLVVDVRAGGDFLDPDAPLHWRDDFKYSGFNTMTLGIWYEAVMRWLGHCRSVSAQAKVFAKSRRDEHGRCAAVRIPDHIDVLAEMECGSELHIQISKVTGLGPRSEVFIFGSKGTIALSGEKLYLGKSSQEALSEYKIEAADEGKWHVEIDFINSIRNGAPVTLTSFEDGLKYMEFTEAAIRSSQLGMTIQLPLLNSL